MFPAFAVVLLYPLLLAATPVLAQEEPFDAHSKREKGTIRFATFNVSLNRSAHGELTAELARGDSVQARQIAEILQRVRPDVILLNEFDYREEDGAVRHFCEQFLAVSMNDHAPLDFPHRFAAPGNTGIPSGADLDRNGTTDGPEDALGFGQFPGQYGMVFLSRFPVVTDSVRTFRNFPWCRMPEALRPVDPKTGAPWYDDEVWERLPLSSKSHWDIPLEVEGQVIHVLCSHPTPPVFDGPEDRNGCRNHDEIRLWADYIGGRADYLSDDQGRGGGLAAGSRFVILGDLNADPLDGNDLQDAAQQLLDHPAIDASLIPSSRGAVEAARLGGESNLAHQGDPAHDTGDFNDTHVGNLRVDYVLPSRGLTPVAGGVFWPASGESGQELNRASDHHLVWLDVRIDSGTRNSP